MSSDNQANYLMKALHCSNLNIDRKKFYSTYHLCLQKKLVVPYQMKFFELTCFNQLEL